MESRHCLLEWDDKRFGIAKNIIISALFVISYDFYFFNIENTFGYESIFNILLFAFSFALQTRVERIEKKTKQYALVFSALYSFALVLGKALYDTNDIRVIWNSFGGVFRFTISIVGFATVFYAGCSILFDALLTYYGKQDVTHNKIRISYLTAWIFIFCSWIPAFLAFYPGICSYDAFHQTNQVMQGIAYYSKYHPPLHTMIWALCFKIGGVLHLHPLCIYSLLQMFLLSMGFTKMIMVLVRKEVSNIFIIFGLLFVSVNPIIAIFSLEMTKDAFFSIFFIWMALLLLELVEGGSAFFEKKSNYIKFIFVLLIACLLRNNMIYVCILSLPIAIIIMRKLWKQMFTLFVIPILLYFFINNFVYDAMGIAEGNVEEALSVPIQQIAYTVNANEKNISMEEQEKISKFIPYEAIRNYNPRFADPVKFSFLRENYDKNATDFWKLWLELFRKYPDEYMNAFLTLNLPYWYPDASPIDKYSGREYVEVTMDSGSYYHISTDSKIPWLYSFYCGFASYEKIKNIPIISKVYSLATPIWLLLFSAIVLLLKKEGKKALVLLPAICLWVTYMAGPVSNFRYIFPIFVLYPLILGMIFEKPLKP